MNGVGAIIYRDYRQRMTNIGFVFWDLLAPLSYLLLFGLGFERMMGGPSVIDGESFGYTAFLVPGVLAMVTFMVAMNTAWGFFMDKDSGIFYEMLTYPITRRQILIGKIGFNVLVSLLCSTLVVLLGLVVFDVPIAWARLPVAALLVVVATASWFFFFSTFAITLTRMDAFNTVTSAAYILLMFFSSMFYPLQGLPAWFRVISYANPLTWQVDLLRFGVLGTGDPTVLLAEAMALAIFCAACLGFAVRAMNRAA
jgi:ABC-2 type transport system permease protein